MYCIETMEKEHANILELLKVVRSMCCQIIEGEKADVEDFRKIIDFARNYSDRQHHGKEEKFLYLISLALTFRYLNFLKRTIKNQISSISLILI